MGFWLRNQCEELYICKRGNIKPFKCSKRNVIEHKHLKHSQKPEIFRLLIEELTGNMSPRIELFAREKHGGWDVLL